jgi:DNA-binding MarR family transcriptional regulator
MTTARTPTATLATTWRQLCRMSADVERELDRALSRHHLLAAEHAALDLLATHPRSRVAALAVEIGRTRPATSRMLDRLAERGLIVRTGSTDDGRVVHVSLTAAGHAALADAEPTYAATLDAHHEQLAQLVRQLADELPVTSASTTPTAPSIQSVSAPESTHRGDPDEPAAGTGEGCASDRAHPKTGRFYMGGGAS